VVEPIVVLIKRSQQPSIDSCVLIEVFEFGSQLVAFVEQRFGEVAFGLRISTVGLFEVVADAGDGVVVRSAIRCDLSESQRELVDSLLDLDVRMLLGVESCSGMCQVLRRVVVKVVEPVGYMASRLEHRRRWDGSGEVAAHAGGGSVGAVAGEDLLERVDGVAQVVAVGDDQDQVLVAAAGGSDVQPATGGRRGGERGTRLTRPASRSTTADDDGWRLHRRVVRGDSCFSRRLPSVGEPQLAWCTDCLKGCEPFG